jgi:hypothetical protein
MVGLDGCRKGIFPSSVHGCSGRSPSDSDSSAVCIVDGSSAALLVTRGKNASSGFMHPKLSILLSILPCLGISYFCNDLKLIAPFGLTPTASHNIIRNHTRQHVIHRRNSSGRDKCKRISWSRFHLTQWLLRLGFNVQNNETKHHMLI